MIRTFVRFFSLTVICAVLISCGTDTESDAESYGNPAEKENGNFRKQQEEGG